MTNDKEPITLPQPFQFSQSNLQDYRTCPRRFAWRYLHQLNWPSVETAPLHESERRMQIGRDFHRLVHQHCLNMPLDRLNAISAENPHLPELAQMWQTYLQYHPPELDDANARLYPEISLSTVLSNHRLTAKIDLLVMLPERALIIDWKTIPYRPTSAMLRARIQSRVYPYVLTRTGASLNQGRPIDPDRLTMMYWFTSNPTSPEIMPYSQAQFAADEAFLSHLMADIESETEFPLTQDEKACRFCVYRSYCERGQTAASFQALDEALGEFSDTDWEEEALDWEQVSEIAY